MNEIDVPLDELDEAILVAATADIEFDEIKNGAF